MKADVGKSISSISSSNGAPPLARCVVWCPRDASADRTLPAKLPKELRELLAPRASSVECHAEPLDALASMVLHERGFVAGTHKDPMLLILIDPSRLVGIDALVAAMSKYAHRAAVWQYDPASPKRLSRYTAPVSPPTTNGASNGHTTGNGNGIGSLPTASPRPHTVAATAPAFVSWVGMPGPMTAPPNTPRPAPRLRLAGDTPTPADTPPKPTAIAQGPTSAIAAPSPSNQTPTNNRKPALTDEEVAMLLGDAPQGPNGVKP